jgi:integrase/recombinase XerD
MLTSQSFSVAAVELPEAGKRNREGQARHLTEDDLARLFPELPDAKWQCVFALAYFTGSRISEVLKLEVSDIETEIVWFRKANTKTKQARAAKIVPELRPFLAAYPFPQSGYLFPSRHNARHTGHLSRQAADLVLREACEYIGLTGVSTHSFRRSFATNLSKQGNSLAKIARLLGHKSATMTARYVE